MRLRNSRVCAIAAARSSAQQVGVRQRIYIVVDLVEPGRGDSGWEARIRAQRCAARDTSKNEEDAAVAVTAIGHPHRHKNLECRIGRAGVPYRDVAPRADDNQPNYLFRTVNPGCDIFPSYLFEP